MEATMPPMAGGTVVSRAMSLLPSSPFGERMGLVVDRQQAIERHVRVALRGRQARMAEQLLDHAQVRAAFEQMRRAGVAQRVGVQVGASGAERAVTLHELLHPAHADAAAE